MTDLLKDINTLYGQARNTTTDAYKQSIKAAGTDAAAQEADLQRQLEQQRKDYLKGRQAIQKESFMRGRNLLAGLSNRGLATSGLTQIGQVQNTLAKGEAITGLADTFTGAAENINTKLGNIRTGLQRYTADQNISMERELAGLDFQERQAQITEAERVGGLRENMFSAVSMIPETDTELRQQVSDIYTAMMSGDYSQEGALADIMGSIPYAGGAEPTAEGEFSALGSDVLGSIQKQSWFPSLGNAEATQLNKLLKGKNFDPTTENGKILNAANGAAATFQQTSRKIGHGDMNDTFSVTVNGQTMTGIQGRELMAMIMSGKITVDPQLAKNLAENASGSVKGTFWQGNRYDAILKPYKAWLEQQGLLKDNYQSVGFSDGINYTGQ